MTFAKYVRRPSGIALIPLFLAGCSRSDASTSTPLTGSAAVAAVFETAEPYSSRTLTHSELDGFFAKNDEYVADSASIASFYRGRKMQFAWIIGDSISANAEAFAMLSGIAEGEVPNAARGTKRVSALFDDAIVDGKRVALCATCATELELRLTAEFFRYSARNPGGTLDRDPRTLSWYIPRAKKDFGRLVDSLADGKMNFGGYEPSHHQYKSLKQQLSRYAKLATEPWSPLTPPAARRKFKDGDTSTVVREIGRKLTVLGDLDVDTAGIRYDTTFSLALRRFQARHGMDPDGVYDAALARALSVSPAERLRTMIINMERLRWVPDEQPPNRLLVNIPEFRLHVFEQDREVMTMEVVVGARATRTVTFRDTLTQVVFSPSWSVPRSIVRNEILPAIEKDPRYLEKHDMEMIGGTNDLPELRQRPGARNPLGRVKFLFPNSYSIYMHDTPAKGLFANEKLAASHGCIRLSNARGLAEYLLESDPEWTSDRIQQAMLSGREQHVKLTVPRPVEIVYFTAWVDSDGVLQFRDDVYGHDAALRAELFASAPASGRGD